jgi:murein DD-endopeptidase MepM/ murein hydrolase activator NlpD
MRNKVNLIAIFITVILGAFLIFVSTKGETLASPNQVYKVYLNGKSIGLIESEDEFLKLVDDKQNEIKSKYNIDKVYPPTGLKIEKVSTYQDNISTAEEIYQIIEETEPFTIDGYVITIKYEDDDKDNLYIYTLDKTVFEEAFYNTVSAFVGADALSDYKNNTQEEITDEGEYIESVYWDEDITIKKALISVNENIFTSKDDLSKYLLFGTTEQQKTYVVKDGDTIADIIDKNNLSIEEFLIANPSIPDKDILLSKDQEVSIGLISPVITVVHEVEVVENITNKYSTEYQSDSTMYQGVTKVIQEGSNGVSKVTEKIQYKNGDINQLFITKSEEITPTVNQIIAKGTMSTPSYSYSTVTVGDEDWYWPTVTPYIITSTFKWRWGKHHNGIDISGCGLGSPVYAATDGVVIETNSSCPNQGYYGSSCGNSWGNYIKISVNNGEYTLIYAHLTNALKVKVGETISRGTRIAAMGNSGSSTGTHLHFAILDSSGSYVNPCKVYSC